MSNKMVNFNGGMEHLRKVIDGLRIMQNNGIISNLQEMHSMLNVAEDMIGRSLDFSICNCGGHTTKRIRDGFIPLRDLNHRDMEMAVKNIKSGDKFVDSVEVFKCPKCGSTNYPTYTNYITQPAFVDPGGWKNEE